MISFLDPRKKSNDFTLFWWPALLLLIKSKWRKTKSKFMNNPAFNFNLFSRSPYHFSKFQSSRKRFVGPVFLEFLKGSATSSYSNVLLWRRLLLRKNKNRKITKWRQFFREFSKLYQLWKKGKSHPISFIKFHILQKRLISQQISMKTTRYSKTLVFLSRILWIFCLFFAENLEWFRESTVVFYLHWNSINCNKNISYWCHI